LFKEGEGVAPARPAKTKRGIPPPREKKTKEIQDEEGEQAMGTVFKTVASNSRVRRSDGGQQYGIQHAGTARYPRLKKAGPMATDCAKTENQQCNKENYSASEIRSEGRKEASSGCRRWKTQPQSEKEKKKPRGLKPS